MQNFFLRNKNILALAGISLVILIIVFGPTMSLLKSRIATKKTLVRQLALLEEKQAILSGIDTVQISERVKKMETIFPSKKPVVELMSSLSKLSAMYGLSFGGITLSPGELGDENKAPEKKTNKNPVNADLHDLRFGFVVAGDFDKISDFLKALENTAPLMKIEKVALTIKGTPILDRSLTSVSAAIDVTAYYQLPPKTIGPVSKPIVLLSKKEEAVLEKIFNFQTFEVVVPEMPVGQTDLFGQAIPL